LVPHNTDAVSASSPGSLLEKLALVPKEALWLANLNSERTRRAYRSDVAHFMATVGIASRDEFRQVARGAVLLWREQMTRDGASAATIRRRLSALSSLYRHLARVTVA
jgi:integrase/recombinase XerD